MKKIKLFFVYIIMSLFFVACAEDGLTVHFQTNLGTTIESMPYTGDSFIMPEDPTREGYTFDGWYIDSLLTQSFQILDLINIEQPTVVLYAKWDINSYVISFDTMNGDPIDPQTYEFEEKILNVIPQKDGYDFIGWYLDETYTTPLLEQSMPAQDITLYAKWEETTIYRVMYFDENGGDNITLLRQPVGSRVYAPEYVHKDGHSFLGWYADPELTIPYIFDVMPSENVIVYAKWEIRMCTLYLDENGGDPLDDLVQWYGTPISLPTPTREGYQFIGWFNMNHTNFKGTTMPDNLTIYALWEDIRFVIHYVSQGEIVGEYHLVYGKTMEDHHIAIPIREGYTFGGWYLDEAGTIPYDFEQPVTSQFTLYAKWIEDPS